MFPLSPFTKKDQLLNTILFTLKTEPSFQSASNLRKQTHNRAFHKCQKEIKLTKKRQTKKLTKRQTEMKNKA